jgi:hypothetical protein
MIMAFTVLKRIKVFFGTCRRDVCHYINKNKKEIRAPNAPYISHPHTKKKVKLFLRGQSPVIK